VIVAASIGGVVVLGLLGGGQLGDIGSVAWFAFFGAFSGAAFWFGAERWSHSK